MLVIYAAVMLLNLVSKDKVGWLILLYNPNPNLYYYLYLNTISERAYRLKASTAAHCTVREYLHKILSTLWIYGVAV